MATVRLPAEAGGRKQRRQETRTFSTTTAGITALADWLAGHRVQRVGLESTGVYWKPVYYLLEDAFEVWLLNAEHLHNVPGRKTDVADSMWIAQLMEHGLVRPGFVPPPPIRELRDLTRHRRTLVEERTRVIQRLEKVMQDAGLKLTSVAPGARPTPPGRPWRDSTVYQCPDCDQRYLGTQRCADCGTWCRRIDRGGLCPACDEPVAFTDLLEGANE